MTIKKLSVALGWCSLLGWLTWSSSLAAQTPVPAERFEPAAPGALFLGQETPNRTPTVWDLQLFASYARRPLSIVNDNGAVELDSQLLSLLQLAWSPTPALTLDVALPVVLSQGGNVRSSPSGGFPATDDLVLGDSRFGAGLRLFEQAGMVPGARLSARVWSTWGQASSYASARAVRYSLALTMGAEYRHWFYSLSAGRRHGFRTHAGGASDSALLAGAGAGLKLGEPWVVAVETQVSSLASRALKADDRVSGEAWLSLGYRTDDLGIRIAAGPGYGARTARPEYRAVLGVRVSMPQLANKAVGVGRAEPETSPLGDDRPDALEKILESTPASPRSPHTPSTAEPPTPAPAMSPTPAATPPATTATPPGVVDSDHDHVPDRLDACPEDFGTSTVPGGLGCPEDADGDGVDDHLDQCPRERGTAEGPKEQLGCPLEVRVSASNIVILQRVHFGPGSEVISPKSLSTVKAVADALRAHPEILQVAVEGHTDDRGLAAKNLALSGKRALSVVRRLVGLGIDERRLRIRGLGPRQPKADNTTEEGRRENRRVEFTIIQRAEQNDRDESTGKSEP